MQDDIDGKFDSPEAIREMRARHARYGLLMQEVGVRGLLELQQKGDLSLDECKQLLAEGLKLENAAAPGGSRKRH